MDNRRRTNIVSGIILILIGVVFILTQFPGLHPEHTWPYFIIGAGLLLFMLGIVLTLPIWQCLPASSAVLAACCFSWRIIRITGLRGYMPGR